MAHVRENPWRIHGGNIHDGYTYVFDKIKNGVRYFACKDTRRKLCNGRAKSDDAGLFYTTQPHNHPADALAEPVRLFKQLLKEGSRNQIESFKDIYDDLRVLHPEAAIRVTYPSVQCSMRTWRRQVQPPVPQTLQEYGDSLMIEEWRRLYLNYNRGVIEVTRIYDADGAVSVVFGNPQFAALISDSTEIFADATYKVTPYIAYQLFTVMAVKYNHAFPFAWALMTRKTQRAYEAVLHHVANVIAPEMRPTSAMTDFEVGLQNAIRTVYPNTTIHGCLFHYCQALQRKLKALGLVQLIVGNLELQDVTRKMMALALLPAALIGPSFRTIQHNCSDEVQEVLHPFFVYYERQWINRVTPAIFSVCWLSRRTNNCIESYHRVLSKKMVVHPAIWMFTKRLAGIQSNVHSDLLSLQQGRSVSRTPKMSYFLKIHRLNAAWRNLEGGLITPQNFVENASHPIRDVADIVQAGVDGEAENPDDIEELVNGPEHNPVANFELPRDNFDNVMQEEGQFFNFGNRLQPDPENNDSDEEGPIYFNL